MNLYKKIIVNNWIDKNKDNIKKYEIYAYEDENVEIVISKIAKTINSSSRFYIWKTSRSILFSIKNIIWNGYNINPILATNTESKQLKEPILYEYNYGLFPYSSVNIIFENDFPELKNNPYYFIDKQLPTLAQIKKKEDILKELENVDISPIIDSTLNIHRYELESKLTKRYELVDIFEKINTNETIEFIQWINDNYKIIYKLHKTNKISQDKFLNWTNTNNITNINIINCYSILNNGTYAKLIINDNMHITLSYTINLRKNINWNDINNNIKNITEFTNSHLNHKLTFKELNIKANLVIEIENVSMQNLKKKISEYIDIFDILKSNKDTINLIYKRASNYNKQGFDAHLYVKNCLYLGIEDEDIINQLIILNNLELGEAKQLLQQEKEVIYELEQQNIKQTETINKINTLIIIELYKNGFYINIINIPNKKELENLIYWISKIMVIAIQKQQKNKITIIKKPIIKEEEEELSNILNDEEEELGKLSFSSSSSSVSSKSSNNIVNGGALGKEKHSYFINLLQKADKDLFLDNYARNKCQAINQPIVFTEEYKKSLIENDNYHFDNDIIYGSKSNIKNVYSCPRLWCPQSKIPLNADIENAKCPIEGEEPMQMFFDNDPKKKRYVKLIKPDENNLCVPCCFKKPPKEEELNKCKHYNNKKIIEIENINDDKDENYLVNNLPVKIGRYGTIPQVLHDLLLPTLKYSICSKSLNKYDKCFVRKGILHKTSKKLKRVYNDSIISAISNGLNFKTKEAFVNDIVKKLNLITYISLENGNVCKAFMDKLPIIPENNKTLIIQLKEHLEEFNLTDKINDIDKINYKLSRLLGIFKSYKKFIDYIKSNDYPTSKSPYYLYSLIIILYNVLIVIWEKQNDNTSILCPYYTSYEDLIGTMELNGELLMLIKEKNYYEPLEFKTKGTDGIKLIPINTLKQLKPLFNECNILKHNYNIIYNNIYSLNTWIKSSDLRIKNKFKIHAVILNSDLSISHFLTNEGFLIIIDNISCSFLPRIIIDFEIDEIIFYDDIINTEYNINILKKDYILFINKCKLLNINYDFGELTTETINEFYFKIIIKNKLITNDIINSQIIDDLYKYQITNYKINKKWFQLQSMIYSKILNLPDNEFNRLITLSRRDRNKKLFELLNIINNPEKRKLTVILDEIPFISKYHIKKFFNNFIIYFKYDFLNPLIKETKYQFIFSQVALQHNLPAKLLIYHPSTPNNNFSNIKTKDYIYNLNINEEINEILPKLFYGTFEKLNTKWTMHKKSKWINMVYIKTPDYDINFIKEFYLWLAKLLNITTNYEDLEITAINNIKTIFIAKDYITIKSLLKDLFDDPNFYNIMAKIIGKKYTNFNLFWDKFYSIISINERIELFNNIIKFSIYPNDFYIIAMSKILNINILTIHRSKYGANNKDEPVIRGNLEDLLLSSTFYKAPTQNYINRPVIIFYKYDDDVKIIYNLIIDKSIIPISEKVIYLKIADIPIAIKYLIDEHLKKI